MITKNAAQLKALIKKVAVENKLSSQIVMQNYLMERLLERLSLSKFKDHFIIKGGFLIAVMVGMKARSTMDLDTTIRGVTLNHKNILEIFNHICSITLEDSVTFFVEHSTNIRNLDDYPGIRVKLLAKYPPLKVPLSVDITTGDIITPDAIDYTFPLFFERRSITLMAYNLETILAEKIETILARNITNTRTRDFYDIYILYHLKWKDCDLTNLSHALEQTTLKRGSHSILSNFRKIMDTICNNQRMQEFWSNYQKEFDFAKNMSFNDICDTILIILNELNFYNFDC